MKLVALQSLNEDAVRSIAPDIEIVKVAGDGLLDAVADADILIGSPPRDGFSEMLRAAGKLKWIHVSSAGVDPLLCPEFLESDVMLTCAKAGPVGPLLAEHAFALMLGLTRGIARSVREGRWNRKGAAGAGAYEVGGKAMGIVGFGGVGKALAKRALAFDMEVIAVKKTPVSEAPSGVCVWTSDRFHDMLERSDVVVVTVPDTPETEGMFDAGAFRRMRRNALLITVGRGRTVETDALVEALRSGEIAGAGLDVVHPEPLPDDHPLWGMPHVIITPHIAGNAPERAVRNRALVLENLKRFVKGEPLLSLVDRAGGY